jgi:hypothetical protein
MKVALLLCGQPRRALETCDIIKKLIIEPNNADVFMHMWYDDDDLYMEKGEIDRGICDIKKGIDKELVEFYKPKGVIVEKQKFKQFNNYNCEYYKFPEKYINNYLNCGKNKELSRDEMKLQVLRYTHLSQLYSNFKCNLIKEEYSLGNNILYDCVIKLRYDAFPKVPLICSNHNMNYIYYEDIGQPDNIISDWFNMGSNTIMNIYSSIFLNFEYLNNNKMYYKRKERINSSGVAVDDNCTISPEYLIRDIMYKYKVHCKPIKIGIDVMDHK